MKPTTPSEFHQLALDKMSAVLGADRARNLMAQILSKLGAELLTAQDLLVFSEHLSRMDGFEGAVGSMLGVTAVMRGARPSGY